MRDNVLSFEQERNGGERVSPAKRRVFSISCWNKCLDFTLPSIKLLGKGSSFPREGRAVSELKPAPTE